MLGGRQPLPKKAAIKSLAACLQELDPIGSWPLALRQVFTAIFCAGEALGIDQLLAATQQFCRLLGGCEPETTASQMVLEIRCNISHVLNINQPAATFPCSVQPAEPTWSSHAAHSPNLFRLRHAQAALCS